MDVSEGLRYGSFISKFSLVMIRDRFQFLKSFADSLSELAKADENLAKDVAWKIINYWIYWEDISSENSVVNAIFLQMKLAIDKWQDISDKRRKANQQRTNIEQNLTKQEQNLTNDEQTVPKDKKEKIKDKKENILTLSKDNEEEKSSFGNAEINKCLELIKNYNWWIIDWTQQNQRNFAKHLINKLKKLDSIKDWKYTWQDTLEIILKIISQNKYYSSKITSPEAIYRNLAVLMQQCKNDVAKQNTDNVILETL